MDNLTEHRMREHSRAIEEELERLRKARSRNSKREEAK